MCVWTIKYNFCYIDRNKFCVWRVLYWYSFVFDEAIKQKIRLLQVFLCAKVFLYFKLTWKFCLHWLLLFQVQFSILDNLCDVLYEVVFLYSIGFDMHSLEKSLLDKSLLHSFKRKSTLQEFLHCIFLLFLWNVKDFHFHMNA